MRGLHSSLWGCSHSKSITEAATWRLLEGALGPGSGVEMRNVGIGRSDYLQFHAASLRFQADLWPRGGGLALVGSEPLVTTVLLLPCATGLV